MIGPIAAGTWGIGSFHRKLSAARREFWSGSRATQPDGEAQRPMSVPRGSRDGAFIWECGLKAALIVAGVLVPVSDVAALWKDKFEVFVGGGVTHDDNVFRLSDASDPAAVLGSSSKGDTYTTTSLGFRLDLPVRRQRFLAGVRWNQHRYDRYSVLDFTDHDGQAIWKWQAGNDLAGELGYTETLELASLANIQGNVQSSAPNPLKTQRKFLNAAYMLTPRWRLRGEVSREKQSNEVFTENDIGINGADLTASYVTPADNQVGVNLRVADGNFPNGQTVGSEVFDNDYRQRTVAAVLDWTLTGHSRMSARAGRINRNYEQLSERDFDGPMYRLTYVWTPTGKFILTAIAQRDISTDEQVNTSFAYVRGVTLYPTLRLTEKFELSGGFEWGSREYLGDPQLVLTGASRTDQVRIAEVKATYKPVRPVTLEMRLHRESRSSTLATADYEDDIVSVSAGIRF